MSEPKSVRVEPAIGSVVVATATEQGCVRGDRYRVVSTGCDLGPTGEQWPSRLLVTLERVDASEVCTESDLRRAQTTHLRRLDNVVQHQVGERLLLVGSERP